MNKRFCFFALFFLCVVMLMPALGRKEKDTAKSNVVQVSGTIRLVGTALFPEIVITSSDNEWYIDSEEMSKLYDFQHRKVTVEGEETVEELKFANGLSAGIRRTLRKIRVISIE
jgi:cytochrome bd-type quinol oxidase subunit 2